MSIIKFLFWFSGFMIFYSYPGYLIVLWLISFFKSHKDNNKKSLDQLEPKVSLLISAYNEEAVIEDKILNSLALNYRKDLLEIVVVSDSSDDRTNDIVTRYTDKGVVLRHYEGRIGKTACLNKAVPLAKGDVIIFTDANSRYDKDVIKELVRHFADDSVGFVTGITKYIVKDGDRAIDSIDVYSLIEERTKLLESKINSCVGADGAIFAIRKHLYQPLNDYDINDFVIPLNIIKQGFRGILTNKALCIEEAATGTKDEFKRQVRITNRTIRAIFNNINLLNTFKFGFFSFELLSHKISKLFVPFFMMILFVSNLILISQGKVYSVVLMGQLICYLTALLKYRGYSINGLTRIFSTFYTFITVNLAILWGWIEYLKGKTYTTWSPMQR